MAKNVRAADVLGATNFSCTLTNALPSVLESQNTASWGFPGGPVIMNPPANAGYMGSVPGPEDPICHGATKPSHHNC